MTSVRHCRVIETMNGDMAGGGELVGDSSAEGMCEGSDA